MMISRLTPKEEILKLGEECERCGHCCTYGSGFVLPEDIKQMSKGLKESPAEIKERYLDEHEIFNTQIHKIKVKKHGKPYGKCIFYIPEEGCTIHEFKPLHCRIGSCKRHGEEAAEWFFLKFIVNPDDPESIRQWAARLKGRKTIPGGALEELVPDKRKLIKILTYKEHEV